MTESKAAGPKTELVGVSSRMQQSIENIIASASDGIADCMIGARNAVSEGPYDNRRSSERHDATKLMTTTAELLASIAKIRGEFSYNYHVTRVEEAAERGRRTVKPGWSGHNSELLTDKEYDLLTERERIDYERWTEGMPPKFGGWKRPKLDASGSPIEDPVPAMNRGATPVDPPPPGNSGSNDNAAES